MGSHPSLPSRARTGHLDSDPDSAWARDFGWAIGPNLSFNSVVFLEVVSGTENLDVRRVLRGSAL